MRTKGYCTDVFFEAGLDWIDRCRQDQKPFFCYVTPNCPHFPYDCPSGSDKKYLGPLEAAGVKDPKQRATIARFYAMIENIDTNMDRLLVTPVGRWERGKAAESALHNCRIREGRWQLVNTKNRPDAWELYDLAADPGEQQNVAADHPDVVTRLGKAYDAWWQSV